MFMKMSSRKKRNRSCKHPCDICEECGTPLEVHHIEGRDIPNPHSATNTTDVCPNCHTKVHIGMIIIEQWVNTTTGRTLLWHESDDEGLIRDSVCHII